MKIKSRSKNYQRYEVFKKDADTFNTDRDLGKDFSSYLVTILSKMSALQMKMLNLEEMLAQSHLPKEPEQPEPIEESVVEPEEQKKSFVSDLEKLRDDIMKKRKKLSDSMHSDVDWNPNPVWYKQQVQTLADKNLKK